MPVVVTPNNPAKRGRGRGILRDYCPGFVAQVPVRKRENAGEGVSGEGNESVLSAPKSDVEIIPSVSSVLEPSAQTVNNNDSLPWARPLNMPTLRQVSNFERTESDPWCHTLYEQADDSDNVNDVIYEWPEGFEHLVPENVVNDYRNNSKMVPYRKYLVSRQNKNDTTATVTYLGLAVFPPSMGKFPNITHNLVANPYVSGAGIMHMTGSELDPSGELPPSNAHSVSYTLAMGTLRELQSTEVFHSASPRITPKDSNAQN